MSSRLLPVLHDADAAFSYECRACNRCCRGRGIQVNPYELIRLSVRLGISTTECRRRWLDRNGIYLAQHDDGRCRFLGEQGCTVHADRPLVCRLYPLGRIIRASGEERYVQLEPAEASDGIYGNDGRVIDYLRGQGVEPYYAAEARYRALMHAMQAKGRASDDTPDEAPVSDKGAQASAEAAEAADAAVRWVLDPDPLISAWCRHEGIAEPADVEARVDCHLAALEAWVLDRWTPPAAE